MGLKGTRLVGFMLPTTPNRFVETASEFAYHTRTRQGCFSLAYDYVSIYLCQVNISLSKNCDPTIISFSYHPR